MRKIRFIDRVKIALSGGGILEVLQRYADEFLAGKDVTINGIGDVSADSAMKFSAVFACNRVLAETLASCPIFEYKKKPDGNREPVRDSYEFEMLHYAPNPDMTIGAFKEFGVSNINLGGNMFAQKLKNSKGQTVQLRPIAWDRIQPEMDKTTGALKYFIDNNQQPFTRNDMLHIPGITLDGYIGITPIEYAQAALKVGISQDTFQQKFYQNGVLVSGVFEHPSALSEDAYARLKKELTVNYAGLKNAGVPMILEDGMKYKEVSMKLSDAQFIESKRFSIEDIARFFRVPQHLIGDLTRSTFNNIEHQSLEFIIYTMLPWFKRWEENLNLQLLTREDRLDGKYFEFKLDAILRGDAEARARAYATARQWGWLSVNDIRRLENMNSIGSKGDIYLQPSNMFEAGKEPTEKEREAQNRALAEEIYEIIVKGGNRND